MRAVFLLLVLALPASSQEMERAVVTAFEHARRLPEVDRRHSRYVFWPEEGQKQESVNYQLTNVQANRLSDRGKFSPPQRVVPGLYRLDTREYGWNKRPEVWERLTALDPFFHWKIKIVADPEAGTYYLTYWPGGKFKDKDFPAGPYKVAPKAGDTLDVPAMWADPLVKLPNGDTVAPHDELRKMCLTEAPIVFGPWWFAQTMRQISPRNKDEGTGPYNFLGLNSRDDMFSLAGFDEKKARERFAAWAAVVEGQTSGISQQNRLVVLMRGATGMLFGTLDVFEEKGRGVLKRNLRPGEFAHVAEEWIFPLPNGMPGELLSDNKGKLVGSAPPEIGGDKSALNIGNDPRVHVGRCMNCHGTANENGIKSLVDWARSTFTLNQKGKGHKIQDPVKDTQIELESLYLRDIDRHIAAARAEYAFAAANLTVSPEHPRGMTFSQMTTMLQQEGWNKYVESRVTLERAALELGVKPMRLKEAIFKYNADRSGGDLVLQAFEKDPPGKISRLEWENSYGYAQVIVRGLKIPEVSAKAKKNEGSR